MKAPGNHVVFTGADSSNIMEYAYDPKSCTLYIRFKSGLYGYPGVTNAQYGDFHTAESKGRHFNAMGIKHIGVKIIE